jgi:predicted alpha/beta superfamily hydrolase
VAKGARVFLALLACWAGISAAQADPGTFQIGETIEIQSAVLGETRPVFVSVPVAYDGISKLPVLFVLDGEEHFTVFASTVAYLSRHTNIPPLMVVGVPNTGHRENNLVPFKSDWSPDGGGADEFLEFFAAELIPFLSSNYNTSGFHMVAGKSYGGMFALYAAMQDDSPFDAYLAASPSVFLKDSQIVKDLWAARETVAKAKFIYVTHASEDDIMRKPFNEITGILDRIMTRANSVGHKFYMHELHETVFLPSLTDALKVMFKEWQVPRYSLRIGVDAVVSHYEGLIETMGLGIEIPERAFSYLGNLASSDKNYDIAIPIYGEGAKRYPHSADAQYYFARGLLRAGRTSEALPAMQAAAKLAKESGRSDATILADKVKEIARALDANE